MYSEYTKNRILALANANKTPTEIVIILKEENIVVVRTTVARIIRRARERKQGQQLQDGRGRPPKASSPVKRKIDEVYRRDPEVTASELKNVLENEQANKFTLALAEKLYGLEQMATATVTGKDCNRKLDPQITLAIKSEVLRIFGSSLSSEEQTKLWNGCIASIAGKCKNLRYARKKALEIAETFNSNNL